MCFFSLRCMPSCVRPAGQSNYAAGSTFEDAFATRLGRDWPCAVKVMWGYWGSVGVVASQAYRERLARVGMGSIEPAEAMEALEHLLANPVHQMAFVQMHKPLVPQRPEKLRLQADQGQVLGPPPWWEMIQAEELIMGFGSEPLPSYAC
ncbi:MAG: KR domain-containing protein, partial [Chloroflexi bacterium]